MQLLYLTQHHLPISSLPTSPCPDSDALESLNHSAGDWHVHAEAVSSVYGEAGIFFPISHDTFLDECYGGACRVLKKTYIVTQVQQLQTESDA